MNTTVKQTWKRTGNKVNPRVWEDSTFCPVLSILMCGPWNTYTCQKDDVTWTTPLTPPLSPTWISTNSHKESYQQCYSAAHKGVLWMTVTWLIHHWKVNPCAAFGSQRPIVVLRQLPNTKTNKKHFILTFGCGGCETAQRLKEKCFSLFLLTEGSQWPEDGDKSQHLSRIDITLQGCKMTVFRNKRIHYYSWCAQM